MLGFLLFLSGLSPAYAETSPFREAFEAYAQVRRAEEKLALATRRHDQDDVTRGNTLHALDAELAKARAHLALFPSRLDAWEQGVLRTAGPSYAAAGGGVDKAGLDFLSRAFGEVATRSWTPLEWQCANEWFGRATGDAFLKIAFAMEELPARATTAPPGALLWIADPLARFAAKDEIAHGAAVHAQVKNQLEKEGYSIQDLDIGAYTRLDEQAEELHLALARRIDEGKPFTLVSSGYASAVLYRTLDLNPGFLSNPSVLGWVNVNGQLFGDDHTISRGPASASKADRPLHEVRHEQLLLREERLGPQTPLGARFPVINLVTLSGTHRPASSLRDSVLPEGRTVYLRDGDGIARLRDALPALIRRAPAGQRDTATHETKF